MKHKHIQENLLLAIAGGIFIISALWLWRIWSGYRAGEEEYKQLQNHALAVMETEGSQSPLPGEETWQGQDIDLGGYQLKEVDFEGLQAQNEEITGWIEMPGLDLSYPVVQGKDNSYYLKRTFLRESNNAGSIFMDMRNDPALSNKNTIIYGHNMRNGSMFGKLKQYREEAVFQENQVFYYYIPGHVYQCQIISCRTVKAREEEYPTGFSDEKSFGKYIEMIEKESWHKSSFTAGTGDRLIMLSTCTGSSTERFVVQARLVEILPRIPSSLL